MNRNTQLTVVFSWIN